MDLEPREASITRNIEYIQEEEDDDYEVYNSLEIDPDWDRGPVDDHLKYPKSVIELMKEKLINRPVTNLGNKILVDCIQEAMLTDENYTDPFEIYIGMLITAKCKDLLDRDDEIDFTEFLMCICDYIQSLLPFVNHHEMPPCLYVLPVLRKDFVNTVYNK